MKKTKAKSLPFHAMPKAYSDLVAMHPPRPLHDAIDHDNALAIVMQLAGHDLTPDQDDYLELLSELIENYERRTLPQPPRTSPLERLRFVVQQAGLSASDLGRLLGNRSLGSALLNGSRELSKTHIRILADTFHLNPAYFL
ncbi:MAG TPA: hypothetical protein VH253_17390 [Phycisphaerae bacterium]|nr:hypothetical protein [Phycisphaerae bacterium]